MSSVDLPRSVTPETEVARYDGGNPSDNREVATGKTQEEDQNIKNNDVYCGSEYSFRQHPGTKIYDELIRKHKESYQTANRREKKTRITNQIIKNVHEKGGRFMKKNDEGKWEEISAKDAHEKVSHALRHDPERRKKRVQKEDRLTMEEHDALCSLLKAHEKSYPQFFSKQKAYG